MAALQAAALPSGSSAACQCPRQESNLVFDLRRVACKSPTLRGHNFFSAPPRNRTSSGSFEDCRAVRHTRRASVSTRNRTWTWTFGGSYAIHYTIETFSVPTWSRTRARVLGEPRAIRYTIGTYHQGRQLDLHQHVAVYRTAALLFGHVGKQEREDLNPVGRLWRPLPLPGGHSCIGPRPCGRGPLA